MLQYAKGDLLNTDAQLICHQVNCKGVMGSGLAKQVRSRFRPVYEIYRGFCHDTEPNVLLGTFLAVTTDGRIVRHNDLERIRTKTIINIFGQNGYGRGGCHTRRDDVLAALVALHRQMCIHRINTVAIPKGMGCGLGGERWSTIEQIIASVFESDPCVTCTIVEYDGGDVK